MRAAATHDVDDTWHRFRAECHGRSRAYITAVHEGAAPADAYGAAYDALTRRGKVHSEEEDPATFRGGFYRAMIKLFDVTIDDRRIQGYNGLADWEEMRDYVFRKFDPAALGGVLAEGRLLVHGGNGAWPRQQITTDLIRHERIEEAVLHVAFGKNGEPCEKASDEEVVSRLARVEAIAAEAGIKPGTLQLSSKVLHVFAPTRWPALTARSTPDVGEELGVPLASVETPQDYLRFADAMRELMRARGHVDLDRTDILVDDTWMMLHGDE